MVQLFSARCTSTARLDGKTAIVTGANTGTGKPIAQDFYLRGARVILACRSLEKAEAAILEIKLNCEGKPNLGLLKTTELDLSSLESVRKCATRILKEEEQVNLLVNNAGVLLSPEKRTKDGFEIHMGVNYFGHFLFTLLLLPKIIKSKSARIINVSSMGHAHTGAPMNIDDINWEKIPYDGKNAYCHSKLANILFTKELARKLEEARITDVTIYSVHPGAVATELIRDIDITFMRGSKWIFKNILFLFFKTPEQGAQTIIHCSVDENAGKETGLYYVECKIKEPASYANSVEDAKKLWEVSYKLVGLEDYDPFSQY